MRSLLSAERIILNYFAAYVRWGGRHRRGDSSSAWKGRGTKIYDTRKDMFPGTAGAGLNYAELGGGAAGH